MPASLEITAAEFLQGSKSCKLYLPKPLLKSRNSHLLFGSTHRKRNSSVRVCSQGVRRNASDKIRAVVSVDSQQLGSVDDFEAEKVIHFFRTPLIQDRAMDELLKSVQTKISDKIVGLKTEQFIGSKFNSVGEELHLAIETIGHGALKENHWLNVGAYLKESGVVVELRLPIDQNHSDLKGGSFCEYGEAVLKHLENKSESDPTLQKTRVNYEGIRVSGYGGWFLLRLFRNPVLPLNIGVNYKS
ncbi:hypothetical protein HanRHA438_Chr17g0821791 [Helianthus annuus]|nr:hypothetical protein HanHA300_Chr17g0660791 [Helianthus annuus]KAJ0448177.1 hypothetical protein HanHA89_Chr17g0713821 [Helianthus annuus]KAJ0633063.1 hypothetical protein HanLR1_Chr17g0672321 [Helianthus annuus]KAJ0827096.1 hypothetical protein HanRHA438_Chr17g0821791 [Helianthus annuus]